MRLRNLFMILLLCMTVGMFGVSCADDGEDGAQGPPGPPGPAGPAGDAGDGADEDTDFYTFLTSWGSATGEVGCDDPILTGSGPLPGGDDALTLKIVSEKAPAVDQSAIEATCGTEQDTMFGTIGITDINTLDEVLALAATDIGDSDGNVARGLVFVKTRKGAAEEEVTQVPSSEFNPATQLTTNKTFVGGKVFANMLLSSSQTLQRLDLYSQCGIGTSPSYIVGEWRAVKIASDVRIFSEGKLNPADDAQTPNEDESIITTIQTTKVCVVLDAHPGVTKCYVEVTGDPVAKNNGKTISFV